MLRPLATDGRAGVPELMGISHIDLTVSDCDRAAAWWQDVVGFTPLNRTSGETFETRSLVHPSGVVVTVMTHDGTSERPSSSAILRTRS
ncbi:MAG: glyoxylase family protein [Mycobacterium sp.]|nr:glyoxylase family protein [Mycobacterium sp.]